ncbi:hypothetical protein BHE74_00047839 [Ensete ventricosum]|nr:hypothetical protein BHE74_00047839 [Ensete ventricosum]RZR96079.1 hypothetical protein BHM03_00025038 [Ensete ventricosum]
MYRLVGGPVRTAQYGALPLGASKVTSNMGKFKDNPDGPKVEGEEGPSITESGYNPRRQEFDPEYDNDAEQALADMEFKENDTETERELKLRVLRIYLSRCVT